MKARQARYLLISVTNTQMSPVICDLVCQCLRLDSDTLPSNDDAVRLVGSVVDPRKRFDTLTSLDILPYAATRAMHALPRLEKLCEAKDVLAASMKYVQLNDTAKVDKTSMAEKQVDAAERFMTICGGNDDPKLREAMALTLLFCGPKKALDVLLQPGSPAHARASKRVFGTCKQ